LPATKNLINLYIHAVFVCEFIVNQLEKGSKGKSKS